MPFVDQRKIAVVGVGAVGAASAYAMMISGLINELVLVDINRERAKGEAMDLAHGASFVKPIRIYAGEYEDCQDADIIIFSAGEPQKSGESRRELVFRNLEVLKNTLPRCISKKGDSILLMVTNPVDVLTYSALHLCKLPPNRVVGSGTVLDSSRFRFLISEHCQVEARNIHAYVVGEHGDTEVLLWSLAKIAGFATQDFCCQRGISWLDKELITRRTREAAYEVITRKGATSFAVALAIKRICESILRDENSVLTVSGLIEGQHGITDVCLSLPSIINRQGRVHVLTVPMAAEEEEALRHSASVLKSIQEQLDLTPLSLLENPQFFTPGYKHQESINYH